jgi:hypothetical protein
MKTQLSKIGVFLLLIMALTACSKKNDVTTVSKKLSYQFKIANPSVPLSSSVHNSNLTTTATSGGNIIWQSGYINILSISFEGKNENNNNMEVVFKKPAAYKVDLFTSSNQSLGNVDILTGIYHNANIRLETKQSSTGSAFYLKGIYTSVKGSIPVELSLNEGNNQMEILANAKNLSIGSKDSYIAFINLHLEKLMAGVTAANLDAATLTSGSILINSNSNVSIYSKIKANINSFSDGDYNN